MHSLTRRVKRSTQRLAAATISTIAPTIDDEHRRLDRERDALPLSAAAASIARNRIEQPKKSARLQRMILRSTVAATLREHRLGGGPC